MPQPTVPPKEAGPLPADLTGPTLPPPGEVVSGQPPRRYVLPEPAMAGTPAMALHPQPAGIPLQRAPGMLEPNPHLRTAPTAKGALLNLAPNETPADRVVELAQKVEMLGSQILVLQNRLREMEATAASREQAIAESRREAEFLTGEANRYRQEIEQLKARIAEMEQEDIEFLKAILASLERILGDPGGRPR